MNWLVVLPFGEWAAGKKNLMEMVRNTCSILPVSAVTIVFNIVRGINKGFFLKKTTDIAVTAMKKFSERCYAASLISQSQTN